ncbi:unnamed protein product [Meganyctiphanes norvegica]|uniref:NACHT domain-containing protein n=1 Tax=Meganyctiphanes norvegica TaxID=48144 RepID=A0AAV2PTH5_MEGNR
MGNILGKAVPGAGAPVPSAYHITDKDRYKLKVIKALDKAGKDTVLLAYQSYKRFDDTITIKEHFLNYPSKSEEDYKKEVRMQYFRDTIDNTPASGEEYDISLLINCMRVLRRLYEIHDDTINRKCQAIADMRNKHCHDLSGISYNEAKKEIKDIECLSMDLLKYLKTKCPSSISHIKDMNKRIKDGIKDILDQPLSQNELEEYSKFSQHLKIFDDEIASYKIRCIDWAKIKMLDFLSVCNDLHDVKLLFTDIIVEKSDRSNRNTPVKYSDIIDFVSNTNLLLLDSEPGGGKTTVVKYTINDWSKEINEMKSSKFKFIFPMLFRDPHLRSVGDLIREKIPKVRESMGDQDVIKCIADPSSDILFVCDGYDECNDHSEQLFDDICSLKEDYDHIKVIVTSRPEAVQKLYKTRPSKLNIDHLKVIGIHESLRPEFLAKHHDALIKAGESKESTKELIVFYKGCSAKHQELYRMPINMAILAWLWAQGPQRVKTIKSAAGLYTEILNFLKEKFSIRIALKPEFKHTLGFSFYNELNNLLKRFEENVFNVSLIAIKCNRIFIDKTGVTCLKQVCIDKKPVFLEELQSTYLLTKLEWKTELQNSLEFPHKGFLDFYAAKCIESQLSPGGKRVKDILLQLYKNDHEQYEAYLSSYQNVLQLLGGILALKDPSLVDDHGADIIVLLQNTGIRNNTQWYTVYYDLIGNTTAADKFARLIAPYLKLENLSIKDAHVEALSSLLLQYVDIDEVKLDISSNDTLPLLPALIDVLRSKNCIIKIEEINDDQFPLWNSIITQYTNIHIDKVIINNKVKSLPFLDMCDYIKEIRCVYSWRDLHTAPNFSRLKKVDTMHAAVSTIDSLPTSLKYLHIGLQQDSEGQDAIYPHGWSRLTERCPGLWEIHVHVRSPMRCDHLSALPDVRWPDLYLSQVKTEEDLHWAVRTAVQLQPTGGYDRIVLPSCQLNANQLCELFKKLGNSGVTVSVRVNIGSRHISRSTKVEDLARQVLGVTVGWVRMMRISPVGRADINSSCEDGTRNTFVISNQ